MNHRACLALSISLLVAPLPGQGDAIGDATCSSVTDAARQLAPGEGRVEVAVFPAHTIYDRLPSGHRVRSHAYNSASGEVMRGIVRSLLAARFTALGDKALVTRLVASNRHPSLYHPDNGVPVALGARMGVDMVIVPEITYQGGADFQLEVKVIRVADGLQRSVVARIQKRDWPFSGSATTALQIELGDGWGEPAGWQPDPVRELEFLLGRATRGVERELWTPAPGGGKVVVIVRGAGGGRTQLDVTLTEQVRERLAASGAELMRAADFEKSCLWPENRSLDLIDPVLADPRERAALRRRMAAAKVDGVIIAETLRELDKVSWRAKTVRRRDGALDIDDRPLGPVVDLDVAEPAGALAAAAGLAKVTPTARREVFTVLARAGVELFEQAQLRAWLQANPDALVGLMPFRARGNDVQRTVLDEFIARLDERRMALFESFQLIRPDATLDALEKLVLDHEQAFVIAGHVYPTLRRAEMAFAEACLQLDISGAVQDLENEAARHVESTLTAAGLIEAGRFAARGSDLEAARRANRMALRQQRRSGRRAGAAQPLQVEAARLLLGAEFWSSGGEMFAAVRLVDMRTGRVLASCRLRALPELSDAAYRVVRQESAPAPQVRLPDPLAGVAPANARRSGGGGGTGGGAQPAAPQDREAYTEARTGCVAYVLADPGGSDRSVVLRVGTCFAVDIGGRTVLVTNRHVVTEEEGGQAVLVTRSSKWRQRGLRLFVYFPLADGSVDGFEADVLGFSTRADVAVIADGRKDKAAYAIAATEALHKGDKLFSCGYPGMPTRVGGHDNTGGKGALVLDDASDPRGYIDIFITSGAFTGVGLPQAGDAIGKRLLYAMKTWGGNSGGPILTEGLEVIGIHAWGFGGERDEKLNGGLLLPDHVDELRRIAQ